MGSKQGKDVVAAGTLIGSLAVAPAHAASASALGGAPSAAALSFSGLAVPVWAPVLLVFALCAAMLFILMWRDHAAEHAARHPHRASASSMPRFSNLVAGWVDAVSALPRRAVSVSQRPAPATARRPAS
jgi:hypothetical protein